MNKYTQRFEELSSQLERLLQTKFTSNGLSGQSDYVDNELFLEWKVKVKSLLSRSCGEDSQHFLEFIKNEKTRSFDTNLEILKRLKSVFNAAKEDFLGGYLTSIRELVQAEVFEDELQQSEALLTSGYFLASAVIAGVVLETGIRSLCDQNNIPHGKLDKMNSDLAKLGIYNKLQQKRITALSDIRNSAAHGKPEEFTTEDVQMMIRDVEQFLAMYLGS